MQAAGEDVDYAVFHAPTGMGKNVLSELVAVSYGRHRAHLCQLFQPRQGRHPAHVIRHPASARAPSARPVGKLARLSCVPTSSGTGAEVAPSAVISDSATGKVPAGRLRAQPSVAIVDPLRTAELPRQALNAYADQCAPRIHAC